MLLGVDEQELRDYGMLLFHAGLYGRSFEYLNAYSTSLVSDCSFSSYRLDVLSHCLDRSISRVFHIWNS